MKAFLMHPGADFDAAAAPPQFAEDLVQDLGLDALFAAMARGDDFLAGVAQTAVLASLTEPAAIRYRQAVLRDCLEQPAVVREMCALAAETITREKGIHHGLLERSPDSRLHRTVDVLEMLVEALRRLRQIADRHARDFRSRAFTTLFAMLTSELDDGYLEVLDDHVRRLRFPKGPLISAELGRGNKGSGYVLRTPFGRGWRDRFPRADRSSYGFRVQDQDQLGLRALGELRDRGIDPVANALAQSTEHILGFFRMLRAELAFYVGCLNLSDRLAEKGEPTCLPEPAGPGKPVFACRGLRDPCLSLALEDSVVGNDMSADGRSLIMITGANQGGKSTFLRSVGVAQLMMQCGMFVAADSLRIDVRDGVFTHFKREEDPTMTSGKLDEELARMSAIVDAMRPNALLLCNESFAATNEREGSEIGRQILHALLDGSGVKVVFVTHMFDLAHSFHNRRDHAVLLLRAERRDDGRRTFRLVEDEPLPTSYGEDLFRRVFGADPVTPPTRARSLRA